MYLQKDLIYKQDWNYLIILDACRYDYFSNFYKDYFEGTLLKVESKGNNTRDWFKNTFDKFLPVVYYSTNATINSGYSNLFLKIIEVFLDSGWLNPYTLNKKFREFPSKKAILHYIQPHLSNKNFPNIQYSLFIKTVFKRNITIERIKEEYVKNLLTVLEACKDLIKILNGKIIITSDHGEMLGEDQLFFHEYSLQLYHPILRHVPWLVIENESFNNWNIRF